MKIKNRQSSLKVYGAFYKSSYAHYLITEYNISMQSRLTSLRIIL